MWPGSENKIPAAGTPGVSSFFFDAFTVLSALLGQKHRVCVCVSLCECVSVCVHTCACVCAKGSSRNWGWVPVCRKGPHKHTYEFLILSQELLSRHGIKWNHGSFKMGNPQIPTPCPLLPVHLSLEGGPQSADMFVPSPGCQRRSSPVFVTLSERH